MVSYSNLNLSFSNDVNMVSLSFFKLGKEPGVVSSLWAVTRKEGSLVQTVS